MKKAYRKTKLRQNKKQALEYYFDNRLKMALAFAAKARGINESCLVEEILQKHYEKIF